MTEDKRPDPKPRKLARLWQAYLSWNEVVEMRKRHTLRISSIEAGKSNLDAQYEQEFMDAMRLDLMIEGGKNNGADGTSVKFVGLRDQMVLTAELTAGPIWNWVISIKGLRSGGLAAQLLAQIDDIGKFSNVSKLWRFAGQAVFDGKAEKNTRGEKSHYNARLKSVCYLVADQFIRQQTPLYVDIYYEEKERLREKFPEKIKDANGKWKYNDAHLHHMAMRKMVKIFLQHLWLKWREAEGLPVTMPYAIAVLGHADYIAPAE